MPKVFLIALLILFHSNRSFCQLSYVEIKSYVSKSPSTLDDLLLQKGFLMSAMENDKYGNLKIVWENHKYPLISMFSLCSWQDTTLQQDSISDKNVSKVNTHKIFSYMPQSKNKFDLIHNEVKRLHLKEEPIESNGRIGMRYFDSYYTVDFVREPLTGGVMYIIEVTFMRHLP